MSEKRAAEGAPEVAEKKAKRAEEEEEDLAEEEDLDDEEEENEEEGEEDDEGAQLSKVCEFGFHVVFHVCGSRWGRRGR